MIFAEENGMRLGLTSGSLSRRGFLRGALAVGAAQVLMRAPGLEAAASAAPKPPGLRTITYNILRAHGYTQSAEAKDLLRAAAPQVPTRLALELSLYQPDVVSFQEAPAEPVVAGIARQMKMNHAFFKGGWNGAVLCRFPIDQAQNCPLITWTERPKDLFTRHWGRAILRAPGGDVQFFSAHLHPSDAAVRAREVSEMLKVMEPALQSGKAVLFQGDLNHEPTGPEYARWKSAGLVDVFSRVDNKGKVQHSFDSHAPFKRIDYVWVNGSLAERATECRILHEGAFRTNPQDPRSFALSDHIPVMANFR